MNRRPGNATIADEIDPDMIALGVRQPWAELICRGIKTIELRPRPTRQRGTILIYATKSNASPAIAQPAVEWHGLQSTDLPRGELVGTVELIDCREVTMQDAQAACVPESFVTGGYGWVLSNPHRFAKPIPVRFLPYGVWFYPFVRKRDDALYGSDKKTC